MPGVKQRVERTATPAKGRPPAQRVEPERWVVYFTALNHGCSRSEAARQAGIAYTTAQRLHMDPAASSGLEFYKRWLTDSERDVLRPSQLGKEAKRALEDFEYFRLRYFGHVSMPWHVKAANIVKEKLESPDKEYVVINCPPGSGKSTLITHDIPTWCLVRNRAMRTLIGTGAQTTGSDYSMRIRSSFDRVLPVQADEREVALGLAVDGIQTLLHDYGRFKPDSTGLWRNDKFTLAREGGAPAHQKEASVAAFGQKSGFLGGRYNLVVWDDVVTDANSRTPVQQAELARWWRSTAESRLEPGGVLVLMGQRLSAHDLYRYALDLRDISDVIDEVDLGDMENLPRKYFHVRFPAHDESKCKGGDSTHADHKPSAQPWPKGCLLDPKRLSYKELRVHQFNDPKTYATVYQQEDQDPGSVLVNPLWINGGQDDKGIQYPGCWDNDRVLGQVPENLSGDVYSVITADPSPSNFWGVIWWLYQQGTDFHHLVDLERRKMGAPEFLDWNHSTQTFSGLLESWFQASKDTGRPIRYVIVEVNAAQKFLLQYDHARRWQSERGVEIVAHDTHRNKSDRDFGVQGLAPHYRHGKVRLPGHWTARPHMMPLYNEVTRYPEAATTDLLMAHWFLLWQAPRLFVPRMIKPPSFPRPSWTRDATRGIRTAS